MAPTLDESTPLVGDVSIVVQSESDNENENEGHGYYAPLIGTVSVLLESASSFKGQVVINMTDDDDNETRKQEEDGIEEGVELEMTNQEGYTSTSLRNDPAQKRAKVAIAVMSSLVVLCICCSFLKVNSLHNRGSPPSTIQLSSAQDAAYSDADFISGRFKNVFTEDQDPGWSQRLRIDEKGNNIAGLAGLTANCKCIMMNKICIYHIASDHSFINALNNTLLLYWYH